MAHFVRFPCLEQRLHRRLSAVLQAVHFAAQTQLQHLRLLQDAQLTLSSREPLLLDRGRAGVEASEREVCLEVEEWPRDWVQLATACGCAIVESSHWRAAAVSLPCDRGRRGRVRCDQRICR